jgi:hypothetical protein
MVFDFYGEDVPQWEIADAANVIENEGTWGGEMVRAAHFSNLSVSIGNELPWNITGYSTRTLGYAAFWKLDLTLDELKTLVADGYPIIVAMLYSLQYPSGHYRVVVGYNETHITLHDPWMWATPYEGPNVNMTYSEFLNLWWNEGIFVSPWTVDILMPESVEENHVFSVEAVVTYTCPEQFLTTEYAAYSVNASITLSDGVSLVSYEKTVKSSPNVMYPAQTACMRWFLVADHVGNYSISIEGDGEISSTYPYAYSDRIGGSNSSTVRVCEVTNPLTGDVNDDGSVDILDVTTITGAYSCKANDTKYRPKADIVSPYGLIDILDVVACTSHYGEKTGQS